MTGFKVNPDRDKFDAYPAMKGVSGVIERFYIAPSRFELRDDDNNAVLDDEGEAIHPDAVKLELRFTYTTADGTDREGTITEEFGKGVLTLMRELAGGDDAWISELPTEKDDDGDESIVFPTDDEGNLLVNGVDVSGYDVTFEMGARKRGDATYNNVRRVKLAVAE